VSHLGNPGLIISHAYTECGHVAQYFGLPNFGGTQHDALIRGARAKTFVTAVNLSEGHDREGLFDDNVRRSVECRTFFPKAA
jgi:hypothetical protein